MSNVHLLLVSALCVTLFVACGDLNDQGTQESTAVRSPTSQTTPSLPGTVIASFGRLEPFEDFESAERRLGWRILRPTDQRFELVQQGGLLRTLPEVGLGRVEQAYAMGGKRQLIEVVQGPEAYELNTQGDPQDIIIGSYEGTLWGTPPEASFVFLTGEEISGQRIVAKVAAFKDTDWSEEDIRDFVSSLAFAE